VQTSVQMYVVFLLAFYPNATPCDFPLHIEDFLRL
jgi:hypothetical protein